MKRKRISEIRNEDRQRRSILRKRRLSIAEKYIHTEDIKSIIIALEFFARHKMFKRIEDYLNSDNPLIRKLKSLSINGEVFWWIKEDGNLWYEINGERIPNKIIIQFIIKNEK